MPGIAKAVEREEYVRSRVLDLQRRLDRAVAVSRGLELPEVKAGQAPAKFGELGGIAKGPGAGGRVQLGSLRQAESIEDVPRLTRFLEKFRELGGIKGRLHRGEFGSLPNDFERALKLAARRLGLGAPVGPGHAQYGKQWLLAMTVLGATQEELREGATMPLRKLLGRVARKGEPRTGLTGLERLQKRVATREGPVPYSYFGQVRPEETLAASRVGYAQAMAPNPAELRRQIRNLRKRVSTKHIQWFNRTKEGLRNPAGFTAKLGAKKQRLAATAQGLKDELSLLSEGTLKNYLRDLRRVAYRAEEGGAARRKFGPSKLVRGRSMRLAKSGTLGLLLGLGTALAAMGAENE
jgi:hypothetical protein